MTNFTGINIWAWLPGSSAPVQAGIFSWTANTGPGHFEYLPEYRALGKSALALDPMKMAMGSPRLVTTRQNGIFGVMRDSGPDAWGVSLIKKHYKVDPNPLERLLLAGTNGAGCIAVGDLTGRSPALWTLEKLEAVGEKWAQDATGVSNADLDTLIEAINPTPTLGGAKPKIELEFDDAQWIVKFPERNDPFDLACAEAAALSLAQDCGIAIPKGHRVVTIGSGGQQVKGILMQRFDRHRVEGGFARHGYASAFTVMDLDDGAEAGNRQSYMQFAHQAMLWCARAGSKEHAIKQRRGIWQRIVLTALIGNADDHSRNHALICKDGQWELSPVFDIMPVTQWNRATLLPFIDKPDGNRLSFDRLIEAARFYKWENADEAKAEIQRMAEIVNTNWELRMREHGASSELIARRSNAFDLTRSIVEEQSARSSPRMF